MGRYEVKELRGVHAGFCHQRSVLIPAEEPIQLHRDMRRIRIVRVSLLSSHVQNVC
jgi:hypothetical protein